VLQYYQTSKQPLPHYLLIIDDTFYKMEIFQEHYSQYADLVRVPSEVTGRRIQGVVLPTPYGVFGFTISQGYLHQIMRLRKAPMRRLS
jgi:hypothetical protein